MTSLLKTSMVLRPMMSRQMSEVVKSQSDKFVFSNGKFTKVPQNVTQVHEEITHTGQVGKIILKFLKYVMVLIVKSILDSFKLFLNVQNF